MKSGDFELLQDYMDGELSKDDRAALEARLQQEPALKEQLHDLQDMIAALKASEKAKLKKKLLNKWPVPQAKQKTSFFLNTSLWKGMAATILLLLVSWFLYNSYAKKESSVSELAMQELEAPYPSPTSLRDSTVQDQAWQAFINAYQNRKYQLAIQQFQTEIAIIEQQSNAYFYLGLCHLYLRPPQVKQAIAALQKSKMEQGLFNTSTDWYLALAYLLDEEYDKAKERLTVLIMEGDWKNEEAKKLLRKIE